jgi:integrase
MARPATGQVVYDTRRKTPVYGLRFRAYGERRYTTLGTTAEGWTREKAETELQNVLADVRRGIWQPPAPTQATSPPTDPTFHEFASQWYEANKGAWRKATRDDYAWQLSSHLLPFFKDHRLSQITVAEVDRYRSAKLKQAERLMAAQAAWERRIAAAADPRMRRQLCNERPRRPVLATSINKTITRLAQILEVAVEYEIIDRNPAKGKRRHVKASKPPAIWLDRAEHVGSLLDAAAQLDSEARGDRRHVRRHAMLATLVFAGLRIGELCNLRWRDVDLGSGKICVRASKTDAGVRRIDMLPILRDVLLALKASGSAGSGDYVFSTASGGPQNPSNIRNRVLAPAVKSANERLERAGDTPLPDGITPHKLRHTFASILVALGVDPGSVMDQLGHTDPAFTLRVYRHGMRRDVVSKRALRELVGLFEEPSVWAAMGSRNAFEPTESYRPGG